MWHFHRDLCFKPDGTVTITVTDGPCQAMGGVFLRETGWLLHAWLWKPNPRGLFEEWNPAVRAG